MLNYISKTFKKQFEHIFRKVANVH